MNPYIFAGIEKTSNSNIEIVGKKGMHTRKTLLGIKFKHSRKQAITDNLYEIINVGENECTLAWSGETVNYLISDVLDYLNQGIWIETK